MRTAINHLPDWKQRELREVVRIILDRFEDAHTRQATQWKKKGRILKIVLYGSHARGDWVYEPNTKRSYLSDFDLLIISNHKRVVDHSDFWNELKERLDNELDVGRIKTPVGMILHTKQDAYSSLAMGRYFWMDVARDGIVIYDGDGDILPVPRPRSPEIMLKLALEYFAKFFKEANTFYNIYRYSLHMDDIDNASFQLHQSVEHLYRTAILVNTLYTPRSHNIGYLRNLAKKLDIEFLDVWPQERHWQKVAFNRLKDAYVKARYSGYFEMEVSHLLWLGAQAEILATIVRKVCDRRFLELSALISTASPGKTYLVKETGVALNSGVGS